MRPVVKSNYRIFFKQLVYKQLNSIWKKILCNFFSSYLRHEFQICVVFLSQLLHQLYILVLHLLECLSGEFHLP